jgi:SAM-dependent methyltransferase
MLEAAGSGVGPSIYLGADMRFLAGCPVCSGTDFETYAESTFTGDPQNAAQYFLANRHAVVHGKIVKCKACGFKFTNPQFEADEYDEIYKAAPGPDGSHIQMEQAESHRFGRLKRYVRDDVSGRGRFLDFGCGRGGFLAAMNDPLGTGFEVGEPSTFMVGPSQVSTGKFFDVAGRPPFEKGAFDFITSFDVFEHLPNLDEYVEALGSLLAPNGRLVITVPDAASWSARLSGRRWNMYLLEHLWFFDEKTLKIFMEHAGFHQIRHRKLPYDAPLAHIVRRAGQTYAWFPPALGKALPDIVLPVPIGLMYSVFQKGRG